MFFIIAILTIGCAVRDVRPGADGVHFVIFLTDDKQESNSSALKQAKRYCKKEKKSHFILSEKTKYICEMEEEEYVRKKKIAQAAKRAGAATSNSAEEHSGKDALGVMLATGALIVEDSLGDCYELTTTFQCK